MHPTKYSYGTSDRAPVFKVGRTDFGPAGLLKVSGVTFCV